MASPQRAEHYSKLVYRLKSEALRMALIVDITAALTAAALTAAALAAATLAAAIAAQQPRFL